MITKLTTFVQTRQREIVRFFKFAAVGALGAVIDFGVLNLLVQLAGLELEAEILGWYDLGVRLALPQLPLAGPADAEVIVVRGDGAAANPLKITVTPPAAPAPVELIPPGIAK